MSKRSFAFLCIAVVLGAFLAVYAMQKRDPQITDSRVAIENPLVEKPVPVAKREIPDGYVQRGGIHRPEKDVAKRQENGEYETPFNFVIGHAPSVDPDTNKSTRLVETALTDASAGKHLTPFVDIEPFDRDTYEQDPGVYTSTVEPARIWQALPPTKDTKKIRRTGEYFHTVLQGERIRLKAKTDANMPITFYSSKLGQFENKLSNITVQADAEGEAEVWYRTTTGQYGDIDLIASSPVRSGFARYLVRVNMPDATAVPNP